MSCHFDKSVSSGAPFEMKQALNAQKNILFSMYADKYREYIFTKKRAESLKISPAGEYDDEYEIERLWSKLEKIEEELGISDISMQQEEEFTYLLEQRVLFLPITFTTGGNINHQGLWQQFIEFVIEELSYRVNKIVFATNEVDFGFYLDNVIGEYKDNAKVIKEGMIYNNFLVEINRELSNLHGGDNREFIDWHNYFHTHL